MDMCTGPAALRCLDEQLVWQLYDDYGYRPRALRPCLTAPHPVWPADLARPTLRRGLLRLLGRPKVRR
jgi:hypothetical protein